MESSSSSSSSSKRAKAPGSISQIAYCLVDGCNADLSLCRDYHRRHKVCEAHSKTAKVTIGGRDQRFCQQCSRFHSLVEFDEGKRSCRKRLDGHNRRRRKPQPDSMARTSPQLVFSTQPATTLLSFSSPQILPSSVVGSTWAGLVKPENDMVMFNNSQQLGYNRVNQLQFLQGSDRATVQSEPPAICQPFPDHHGLDQVVANGSDRALSLLSSGPTLARQSMVHNMQFSGLGPFQEEMKPVISSTGPHSESASTTLHFPEMFHNGPEGSSASGTSPHQTLTFMWE